MSKTNRCRLHEAHLRTNGNQDNGGLLENGRDDKKASSRNEMRLEYSSRFLRRDIDRPFVTSAVAAIKSQETIASRRDRARSSADYRDAAPFRPIRD